jgi:putative redox protein
MGKHMKTVTTWKSGKAFTSNYNNHSIEVSGDGFSMKALLLSGLSGCSGIDVVLILEKMRVPFADLDIVAETEQTDIDPKVFKDIRLTYRIRTDEENREKVKKAIELSLTKYCGVSAMLGKHSKINYTLELLPEAVIGQ